MGNVFAICHCVLISVVGAAIHITSIDAAQFIQSSIFLQNPLFLWQHAVHHPFLPVLCHILYKKANWGIRMELPIKIETGNHGYTYLVGLFPQSHIGHMR